MAQEILETHEELVQRQIDDLKANQSQITDLNEGSEARNLISATGLLAYEARYWIDWMTKQGFPHTAEGDQLDSVGLMVGIYRQDSVKASGAVTLTRSNGAASDLNIPIGTTVYASLNPDVLYETTEEGNFTTGVTDITLDVEATTSGLNTNAGIGAIDTVDTLFSQALTVTNAAALSNGADVESDDDLRIRIIEAGKSREMGSIKWYESLVNTVTGVHDTSLINNPFSQSNQVLILVNGDSRPTDNELITDVEDLFSDEANQIGGVNLNIAKPNFIVQNIVATVTLKSGYTWETVEADVETNITAYVNGGTTSYGVVYPGLNIGDDIISSQIGFIILNTEGVQDYILTAPSSNTSVGTMDAAQLGTITLTEG